MNLRHFMDETRDALSPWNVAVWGQKANGDHHWGTGILLDFRGLPLLLSCAHVLDPLVGDALVVTGRRHAPGFIAVPVSTRRKSNPTMDAACLVLRERPSEPWRAFFPASDAVSARLAPDELVFLYGFPAGNAYLQKGAQIDPGAKTAAFASMTYLTVTGTPMQNQELNGRVQARLDWNFKANLHGKTFRRLENADLTKEQRGGFSGGPVVLQDGRRLAGQVTHMSDYSGFYNDIGDVLHWLDMLRL